jgi:hypothetical protein
MNVIDFMRSELDAENGNAARVFRRDRIYADHIG